MDQNPPPPPKEPRSPVNLRIKFRSESIDQFIERYAIDVSRGGIFIRTREPLAVGTQLKLDFQYQNGTPLMAGEGTVVWIRDPDPNRANVPPGMGVRFDRLTAESQGVLDQLLEDKARREKTGALHPPTDRSGGMAVRRPSSMFAALEPDHPARTAGQPAASPSAASNVPSPTSSNFPGRPSAAYMTVSAATAAAGAPLKPATIVPTSGGAAGASSPRATAPTLLGAGAARNVPPASSTTSTEQTTRAPYPLPPAAIGGGSSSSSAQPSGAITKPFGAARNSVPSMSAVTSSKAASSAPPISPRGTSTLSIVGGRSSIGPSTPTPLGNPIEALRLDDGDNDMNEEPTQIAGRMPSFLLSTDEDPTSVAARPGGAEAERRRPMPGPMFDPMASAMSLLADEATRVGEAPPDLSSAVPPKQSLDLAPPIGGGQPLPPLGGADPRSTGEQIISATRDRLAALDPVAALDSTAPGTSPRGLSAPPPALAAPIAPATTVTAAKASSAARKSQGKIVGLTVVALGVSAFFVFRFFASQSTQQPAGSSPAVTIRPAEPEGERIKEPAGKPAGEPTLGKSADDEAAKAELNALAKKEAAGEAAAAKPAQPEGAAAAKPSARPEKGADRGGRADTAANDGADAKGSGKTVATVDPAARKAAVRKKPSKASGRDVEPAPVAAAVAVAEKPVAPIEPKPVEPVAAAPAEAPAAPSADTAAGAPVDGAASGHQIRVTSKPVGADVAIDGQVVGQTPLVTNIADISAPHFLSVRKEGFETFEQMISSSSAWTKAKGAKGQAAIPTLKISAKLKSSGGAAAGAAAAGAEGAAPAAVAKEPSPATKADEPLAPSPAAEEKPAQ